MHRRGHRTTNSELRLHGGRAGLVTAVDLGRGFTIDLALGGTLFFAGHEDAHHSLYLPASTEEGTTHKRYGLKAQGQMDARLQWDALRMRRGAVHVAVTAFHELGGPAGHASLTLQSRPTAFQGLSVSTSARTDNVLAPLRSVIRGPYPLA